MENFVKRIKLTYVNCYLVKAREGFVLIDSGYPSKLSSLEEELISEGVKPGNLTLIIITHGDFDHIGNCVYLRDKYKSKILMHSMEAKTVESGDMTYNRKAKTDKHSLFFRLISSFGGSEKYQGFSPDLIVSDNEDLTIYGFDAKIILIPGHTKGSIGVYTQEGNFFCGDLLKNYRKPSLHFFIDDMSSARESINTLINLGVKKIFPGHGKPFLMEEFLKRYK
ncbi:MAG: MBL fold metallo-hydrolase [Promethearchaeota archaeon]